MELAGAIVRPDPGRGLAVFASRNLAPGTQLVGARAAGVVPTDDQLFERCSFCLRPVASGQGWECPDCQITRICAQCCTADPGANLTARECHAVECAALCLLTCGSEEAGSEEDQPAAGDMEEDEEEAALSDDASDCSDDEQAAPPARNAAMENLRLLIRLVALHSLRDRGTAPGHAPFGLALELHRESVEQLRQSDPARAEMISSAVDPLMELLQEAGLECTQAVVEDLCAIQQCNCHELADISTVFSPARSNTVGMGLFPGACRFNHACAPSCSYSLGWAADRGCTVNVSVRAAAVPVGGQLTISYTALHRPRHVRRSALKETFGFDCDCTRCDCAADDCKVAGFESPQQLGIWPVDLLSPEEQQAARQLQSNVEQELGDLDAGPPAAPAGQRAVEAAQQPVRGVVMSRSHYLMVHAHRLAAVERAEAGEAAAACEHLISALLGRMEALDEAGAAGSFATVCDLQLLADLTAAGGGLESTAAEGNVARLTSAALAVQKEALQASLALCSGNRGECGGSRSRFNYAVTDGTQYRPGLLSRAVGQSTSALMMAQTFRDSKKSKRKKRVKNNETQ